MKIGVISDTHNHLDPRVLALFAGVDHILHAGDVGQAWILLELERIAPVTAVLGNTDGALPLRDTERVELGRRAFVLHHMVNPQTPPEAVCRHLAAGAVDAVVFGHTHRPYAARLDNTLFFNPGYAGRPRFGMARSVGLLHCDETGIRHEFLRLA